MVLRAGGVPVAANAVASGVAGLCIVDPQVQRLIRIGPLFAAIVAGEDRFVGQAEEWVRRHNETSVIELLPFSAQQAAAVVDRTLALVPDLRDPPSSTRHGHVCGCRHNDTRQS